MEDETKELTLEEALRALEELTSDMEEKELSLDESFSMYQKGMELIRYCSERLDTVEKQLIVLQQEE